MNDFVEQCRREWTRLGVPDPFAEEMAADLTADLAEAEADGVSAEEFLGNSVFDPRSFAAAWAAERGVIPAQAAPRRVRRRPLVLWAFTGLAALTVVVAAVLLATGEPKISLTTSGGPRSHLVPSPPSAVIPPGPGRQVLPGNAAAPIEWILLFLSVMALGFAAWLWFGWRRTQPPAATA
jgi:hypothetical protein